MLLPENIDAAVAVGEKEHVVVIVPGNLVHLKLELFLCSGSMRFGVNERHHVVFVADGDGLTVRTPADVNILPYKEIFGIDIQLINTTFCLLFQEPFYILRSTGTRIELYL